MARSISLVRAPVAPRLPSRLHLDLLLLVGLLATMVLSPHPAAASTSSQAAIPDPQVTAPAGQPRTPDPQPPPDGRWSLLNVPPARSQHTALWDATGEQMLVFGGSVGSRAGDVWSYKPATDRWAQVS